MVYEACTLYNSSMLFIRPNLANMRMGNWEWGSATTSMDERISKNQARRRREKKRQQECKQNILQLVAVWTTHVISLSIIHYEDDIWLLHQFEHWSIVTVSNVHAKFYANQMVISKNWNFERIHSARISRENQRGNANTFAQEKHICDSENPLIPKSKIRNTSRLEIAWNFRKKQIKVGRAI